MKTSVWGCLGSVCFLLGSQLGTAAELPDSVVAEGLGVNIHFMEPQPGEMQMLADAGFRWVRMDFAWETTEVEKGKYDFSAYERFLKTLDAYKIRAILIFDYANPHYDQGLSPSSDEGRAAFARWAVAAVRHFRNRGVVWEMYNEPNIGWSPKPDVHQYVKLALTVGKALREAKLDVPFMGPALSCINLRFIEECFKAGMLEYWSAVSVHTYEARESPETVVPEYNLLRKLIDRYAPKGKTIPIISSEWGYSSGWKDFNEDRQGKCLPRQWLTNLAYGAPISIWYDWHDDGQDPKEPEHHFGTVYNPYFKGQTPVYWPKPAYLAAQTLTKTLAGYRFQKRLPVGGKDDYVMAFAKGDEVRLAAWTMAAQAHAVVIAVRPGKYAAVGHIGQPLPTVVTDAKGLSMVLTDAPTYLCPSR